MFLFQDAAEDEPSHRPILDPARDESSITEQTPEPSTASFALTFKIIEYSTSKGRPKLIDSRGNAGNAWNRCQTPSSQRHWLDMHQKTQGEYNFIYF